MKLIVLSGPSGSGKTTLAMDLSCNDAVYVGYDSSTPLSLEPGLRMKALLGLAGGLLRKGRDVIVDACNLHPHDRIRWETVAWAFGAELEWIQMATPVDECIRRDSRREDPVGEMRIWEQVRRSRRSLWQ